ncbi:hypothetical protein [Pseudaquabacterium pictum]|uniref:DUF2059 domain-containing protein n=1 Tax=Pseudaquabacterium pictum TaxID=2315236 RepID=A0A480AM44_9BURK|nr:hypothetical protein [Rubrivivax pictus]GCL62654.1 hypothetical protein AQPW35_17350 [Rubrivivax pictus]
MTFFTRLACTALLSTVAAAAMAQGAVSPAKKELVQKVLTLQQAGIEGIGNALANQTANQVLQVAGQAVARVPAEKREALAAELQAEVKKFFDDIAPVLRASAVKTAPTTIGTALEEKFSEDELKVLVTWLESPVSKKYQQMSGELQQSLGQKLVADTRPQIEPKLKALEGVLGSKLQAAAGESGGAAPGAAAARPAGPRASGPAKK